MDLTEKQNQFFEYLTARMDEDGYFYIEDRKKDMIIAGGYNIYPREVEEVLASHPDVLEVAVAGVPDPRLQGPFHAQAASGFRIRRLVLAFRRRRVAVPLRRHLCVGQLEGRRRRSLIARPSRGWGRPAGRPFAF